MEGGGGGGACMYSTGVHFLPNFTVDCAAYIFYYEWSLVYYMPPFLSLQKTPFPKAWEDSNSHVFLADWPVRLIPGFLTVGKVL